MRSSLPRRRLKKKNQEEAADLAEKKAVEDKRKAAEDRSDRRSFLPLSTRTRVRRTSNSETIKYEFRLTLI